MYSHILSTKIDKKSEFRVGRSPGCVLTTLCIDLYFGGV